MSKLGIIDEIIQIIQLAIIDSALPTDKRTSLVLITMDRLVSLSRADLIELRDRLRSNQCA